MRRLLVVGAAVLLLAGSLRADTPSEKDAVGELERAAAYSGTPNPAVLKMTPMEYATAMSQLHPALMPPADDIRRALDYGSSVHKKKFEDVFDRWQLTVGGLKDRVSPLFPVNKLVYHAWDKSRTYNEVDYGAFVGTVPTHYISFTVAMARPRGFKELNDVKFVLEVDGKYFQPAGGTGGSEMASATETRVYSVPQTQTTRSSGSVYGSGGWANYNGQSRTTSWRQFSKQKDWYYRSFNVSFDVLNPDGTPRILKSAKSAALVMIMDGREKKAKLNLSEWTGSALPKVKK